jgi:hypothetical protein
MASSRWLLAAAGVLLAAFAGAGRARAACRTLVVELEPAPFDVERDPRGYREAGGPQVALWLADRTGRWVTDLGVTRLVATYGLGNRPGVWNFASSPRFPYGRRVQALPVWAFSRAAARGVDYPELGFWNDQPETATRFHNDISSDDPFYCRPLRVSEIVDAVTCPTPRFGSCKGDAHPTRRSPYPPRNDLASARPGDAAIVDTFGALNELDAVSMATPAPGTPATLRFPLPPGLQPAEYLVEVEVNKEYDQNASHRYPVQVDSLKPDLYGDPENLGQPSIVWAVPLQLGDQPAVGVAVAAAGYGPWDGQPGGAVAVAGDLLRPIDATISDAPGSGTGRLVVREAPEGRFRVRASTADCEPEAACRAAALRDVEGISVAPESNRARVTFAHAAIEEAGVARAAEGYDVRYRVGLSMSEAEFGAATPAHVVAPGAPGSPAEVELDGLKPETGYAVGVRAHGPCGRSSGLRVAVFSTPAIPFRTVEGCFVATAAFGSPLAAEVSALRAARDRVLAHSVPGRAFVMVYYRVSPALAAIIAGSPLLRGLAREALTPLVAAARSLL